MTHNPPYLPHYAAVTTEPHEFQRRTDDVREIAVPARWYLGAHGDPIAQFDYLILRLHPDGSVTWRDDRPIGEVTP